MFKISKICLKYHVLSIFSHRLLRNPVKISLRYALGRYWNKTFIVEFYLGFFENNIPRLRFSGIISSRTCRIRRQFGFEYKCAFCQESKRGCLSSSILSGRAGPPTESTDRPGRSNSIRPRATRGERRRRGRMAWKLS